MSDVEEPPTKMSKYEEYLDENITDAEDCLDEGQEEWLSDGVLTDDEYNTIENERNDSQLDDTTTEGPDSISNMDTKEAAKNDTSIKTDQNIEDTLNNLDNGNELPKDLETFIVRKTANNVVEIKAKGDSEKLEDDGNDTDDLLRLLEDDQQKKKKTLKMVKSRKSQDDQDTTDDEFTYEQSKMRTLKITKSPVMKKVPTKAVPEDMSDSDDDETDASSEGGTMKKIFGLKEVIPKREQRGKLKAPNGSKYAEKSVKMNDSKQQNNTNGKSKPPNQKGILKTNKSKSDMKIMKSVEIKLPASFKKQNKSSSHQQSGMKNNDSDEQEESEEIIDEEEFLEDDDFDLDEEEFGVESEGDVSKQRIMKPESMDEEIPSDDDSQSLDGSIYDELPSSDSEDFDDWFTLDIRAETASDYLPLLGKSAHSLLMAEKLRATERVSSLRTSLSALTESARRQADALRNAAMALAEIDDTLRAA